VPVILGLAGRRAVSVTLLLASVLGLAASAPAQNDRSDPLCPHIVACQYEAPAFTIRVVDQQTGQPLADVHAIASWLIYGFHGRRGVLMALEAISGPDGQLSFPAWGPRRSATEGMVYGRDPMISLFRAGYRAKLIYNTSSYGPASPERVHAFAQAGEKFELTPFQGTPEEALLELRKADDPSEGAYPGPDDPKQLRRMYVDRLTRIKMEVERLPQSMPQVQRYRKILEDDLRFFRAEGGP
jgi:hypothetical protein